MKSNRIRLSILTILSSLFLVFAFSTKIFSQEDTCVSGKCHAALGKGKVVHNPVKEGMCSACHQAVQEAGKKTKHPNNLTITLMQQGADLCTMCHEPKNTKKVVHAPIQGGDCTSCHNPHQSEHKAMLREAAPKLCFQCHPESMVKNKVKHMPVEGGDCSSCHDNHQSDFANRLMQDGNGVCFGCHPDKQEGMKSKKAVHAPVVQSCTLCHNPHSAPHKGLVSAPVPALCSNCHPTEAALSYKALTKHGPMTDSSTCRNCHDPHFADQPKLLPLAHFDLCIGCHSMEMETESGKIKDMGTFLGATKDGHGPVRQKDCVSCHNPHGSDYWRLLLKYYPSTFYTSYSDGKYGLCFMCHSKSAFAELRTAKDTGFRDGEKNLHYIHVNKMGKGRTCRACHEVHASSGLPKHIKETVGFNGWKMPMNFTKSANGGACLPGCHGEKRYAR